MRTTNIVVYAVFDGARRPISSHEEGKHDSPKHYVSHCISEAYRAADRGGQPHPGIVVVRETRADGENETKSARFVRLDPDTLKPLVSDDKGASDLDAIFNAKKVSA